MLVNSSLIKLKKKSISYSKTGIGSQQQNNAGSKNSGQSINLVMVVMHYLYHVYLQLSYK